MRKAGILMPITSLPSPWGVGTLGETAREFVDFLKKAGQSCWQVLPIGPTGYGDSPYQSFSSFAGNPYLIDLDDLSEEGLLSPEEYRHISWGEDPARTDYGLLYQHRFQVLEKAVKRMERKWPEELEEFCEKEKDWLNDYALFMALKEKFQGDPWSRWPRPLRVREEEAVLRARGELANEIRFWKGVQFLFFRQWEALKDLTREKGISIIGDIPIYVAEDSADVWAHPEQFQMDEELRPRKVAGCPPDGFSATGQLWGNPLFDWEKMGRTDTGGGSSASPFSSGFMTFSASIISGDLNPIMPSPTGRRTPAAEAGSRAPAWSFSGGWRKRWGESRSLRRIWDLSPLRFAGFWKIRVFPG